MKESTQEKMTRGNGQTLEAHNEEKMLRAVNYSLKFLYWFYSLEQITTLDPKICN